MRKKIRTKLPGTRCSSCGKKEKAKDLRDGLCARCWFAKWRRDIRGGREPEEYNPWA